MLLSIPKGLMYEKSVSTMAIRGLSLFILMNTMACNRITMNGKAVNHKESHML